MLWVWSCHFGVGTPVVFPICVNWDFGFEAWRCGSRCALMWLCLVSYVSAKGLGYKQVGVLSNCIVYVRLCLRSGSRLAIFRAWSALCSYSVGICKYQAMGVVPEALD